MLYVEGPRDREVLSTWSKRLAPRLTRVIDQNTTILGGRQPVRALDDFRKRGGLAAGLKGLVVLDRDDQDEDAAASEIHSLGEHGLDCFVWGQRHIESYLLVPAVIRRLIGFDPEDRRIEEILAATSPERTDWALGTPGERAVHAKRILGPGGSLSKALGVSLPAGDIAREMRREELHEDVHGLFRQISSLAGVPGGGDAPVVVRLRQRGES